MLKCLKLVTNRHLLNVSIRLVVVSVEGSYASFIM
jgi:hypothetical protein